MTGPGEYSKHRNRSGIPERVDPEITAVETPNRSRTGRDTQELIVVETRPDVMDAIVRSVCEAMERGPLAREMRSRLAKIEQRLDDMDLILHALTEVV